MIKMFEGFELDMKALILSIIFSFMFIAMVWKVPTWENYPFLPKVFMSIVVFPILYFICLWQVNR